MKAHPALFLKWLARFQRWIVIGLLSAALIAGIGSGAIWWLDTNSGRSWLSQQLTGLETKTGFSVQVGAIHGSLFDKIIASDVTLRDPQGAWATIPRLEITWRPWTLLTQEIDVARVRAPTVNLNRLPKFRKVEPEGPVLPDIQLRLGSLVIDQLILGEKITSTRPIILRAQGGAHLGDKRLQIHLRAAGLKTADQLNLDLSAEPDRDKFSLEASVLAPAQGGLASISGFNQDFRAIVHGRGSWSHWTGDASATLGGHPLAMLKIKLLKGQLGLEGTAFAAPSFPPSVRKILTPGLKIRASSRREKEALSTQVHINSTLLEAVASANINLETGGLSDTRASISLAEPKLIAPELSGARLNVGIVASGRYNRPLISLSATTDHLAWRTIGARPVTLKATIDTKKPTKQANFSIQTRQLSGLPSGLEALAQKPQISGLLTIDTQTGDLRFLKTKIDTAQTSTQVEGMLNLYKGPYSFKLSALLRDIDVKGLAQTSLMADGIIAGDNLTSPPRASGSFQTTQIIPSTAQLKKLLGAKAELKGSVIRHSKGVVTITDLRLDKAPLTMTGAGHITSDNQIEFAANGVLSDVKALGLETAAAGPLQLALKADGSLQNPQLTLIARLPNALLAGQNLTDLTLAATSQNLSRYRVELTGNGDLGPIQGRANLSLSPNFALNDLALKLGALNVQGKIRKISTGWDGQARLSGAGLAGSVSLTSYDQATFADIDLTGHNVNLGRVSPFHADQLTAKGRVRLTKLSPDFQGTASLKNASFGVLRLENLRLSGVRRGETTQVDLTASGERNIPFNVAASARLAQHHVQVTGSGSIAKQPFKLARPVDVTFDKGTWTISPALIQSSKGNLQLSGAWGERQRWAEMKLDKISAETISIAFPNVDLTGNVSGSLNFMQQAGQTPTGKADLTFRNIRRASLIGPSTPLDIRIVGLLRAHDGELAASAFQQGRRSGDLRLRLSPLPYQPDKPLSINWAAAPMRGSFHWEGSADTLWGLADLQGHDVKGSLRVDAQINGRLGNPVMKGQMQFEGGRYENLATGLRLTNVKLDAVFNGARLEIKSLSGTSGKDGTLYASGWAELSAERHFPLDIHVQGTRAALFQRDDLEATGSLDVRVTHGPTGGFINGTVELAKTRIRIGGSSTKPIPEIPVEETGAIAGINNFTPSPKQTDQPWRLGLSIKANDQVLIDGLGMLSEWRGNMNISGTTNTPLIQGRFELRRGTYDFSGKRFQLTRGQILFQGDSPPNPLVDIVASLDLNGTTAQLLIRGTARQPKIEFTSNPSLPQDEILARILFGTSVGKLSAPDALQLAAALSALRNGDDGLNIAGRVRKVIGLDRLGIQPSDKSKGIGTTFSGGKYLTDRVYVEVSTDGRGYTATLIEIDLTRSLSILSRAATLGSPSIAVKWSKDY